MKRLREEWRSGAREAILLVLVWLVWTCGIHAIVVFLAGPAWLRLSIAGLGAAALGFICAALARRYDKPPISFLILIGGLQTGLGAASAVFRGDERFWIGAAGIIGGAMCAIGGALIYCWRTKDFRVFNTRQPGVR